jgi:hypothetical protein
LERGTEMFVIPSVNWRGLLYRLSNFSTTITTKGVFGNTVFQNHDISNTTVYKSHDMISVFITTVLEYHSFEYMEVFGNKLYSL